MSATYSIYGMPSDPKPARRIVNDLAGREKCKREGRCRVTGSRNIDRFHLVGKDLGGDDVDANIVPIDHDLHMEWEHGPRGKQEVGPRIWATLLPNERAYVMATKGTRYIERYFGVNHEARSTA